MHVFVCICYVMFVGFVWWFIHLTSMSTKFNWRTNVKNTKSITYFAIAWSNTNTPKNYMLHLFPIWTISKFTASKNRSQNKWIINFHLVAYCFQHFVNYLRHTCTTTKHFNFKFIYEIDKATRCTFRTIASTEYLSVWARSLPETSYFNKMVS